MAATALNRVAVGSVALGGIGFLLQQSMFNVDGGERVVIWNRFKGVESTVYGEGTHFLIPFMQYPNYFDIRLRPRVYSTSTGTKDLQTVNLALRVLARPQQEHLPSLFKNVGVDWDERIMPGIVNDVLKQVAAQYDASQLLTQREEVSRAMRQALNDRAATFNIALDDVSITHLTFGEEFTRAIEAKQVAQQDAERSTFVVARAEQLKEAAIIKAEGESEAAKMISAAMASSGNGFLEIRKIEAAKEIARTMARARNVTYVPGASNMLLNLQPHGHHE